METILPILYGVLMGLLIAVVQFLPKMKAEGFSLGKLIRTGVTGLVVGVVSGIAGVEVTHENFLTLGAANAGTVVAIESFIKLALRYFGVNIAVVLALLLALPATSCMAQEVTMFRWGAPAALEDGSALPPSDIAGYDLYCGPSQEELLAPVGVGNVDTAPIETVLGPHPDAVYACATTVHLTNGLASAYSGFVSVVKRDGRYFNGDSPSAPSWLRVE